MTERWIYKILFFMIYKKSIDMAWSCPKNGRQETGGSNNCSSGYRQEGGRREHHE
jgi:hypothetical protein